MGLSTAMLNTGLLLDKYSVFNSANSYLAADVTHDSRQQMPFDLNKWLSFNYFKMASQHQDTKDEAMLKLGDFYYYGFQPLYQQSYSKAAHIYKYVEQNSKDSELKGQALFNLGLIYHFGSTSLYNRNIQPSQPETFSHLGATGENTIKIDLT